MADITGDFIRKLNTNGGEAERVARAERAAGILGPAGSIVGTSARWVWFYQKVRNGGPWDFKNNDYKRYRTSGVTICGRHFRYDMTGNFHFGFVGAAAGFSSTMLFRGAGEAQERAGTSRPEYHCTYGDDPEDHEFIRLGILLYGQAGLNVNATNLGQTLDQFNRITCPPP